MTGWNLPPGCNVSDLPGNSKADQEEEALGDALAEAMGDLFTDDERFDKLYSWVSKLRSDAYADGYAQGAADERMAADYKDFDRYKGI